MHIHECRPRFQRCDRKLKRTSFGLRMLTAIELKVFSYQGSFLKFKLVFGVETLCATFLGDTCLGAGVFFLVGMTQTPDTQLDVFKQPS